MLANNKWWVVHWWLMWHFMSFSVCHLSMMVVVLMTTIFYLVACNTSFYQFIRTLLTAIKCQANLYGLKKRANKRTRKPIERKDKLKRNERSNNTSRHSFSPEEFLISIAMRDECTLFTTKMPDEKSEEEKNTNNNKRPRAQCERENMQCDAWVEISTFVYCVIKSSHNWPLSVKLRLSMPLS